MKYPMVGKLKFQAGLMFRRKVRSELAMRDLQAQEFRGLIDSWFVVEGESEAVWRFYEWLGRASGQEVSEAQRVMYAQQVFMHKNLGLVDNLGLGRPKQPQPLDIHPFPCIVDIIARRSPETEGRLLHLGASHEKIRQEKRRRQALLIRGGPCASTGR